LIDFPPNPIQRPFSLISIFYSCQGGCPVELQFLGKEKTGQTNCQLVIPSYFNIIPVREKLKLICRSHLLWYLNLVLGIFIFDFLSKEVLVASKL